MSFYFNGAQANVVISGGLTVNPAVQVGGTGQAIINITATGNGALQSKYTVTSGKTFYLMGAVKCEATAGQLYIYKTDGSTLVGTLASTTSVAPVQTGAAPIWSYAAGEIVKVNCTNTNYYSLWGIEQ